MRCCRVNHRAETGGWSKTWSHPNSTFAAWCQPSIGRRVSFETVVQSTIKPKTGTNIHCDSPLAIGTMDLGEVGSIREVDELERWKVKQAYSNSKSHCWSNRWDSTKKQPSPNNLSLDHPNPNPTGCLDERWISKSDPVMNDHWTTRPLNPTECDYAHPWDRLDSAMAINGLDDWSQNHWDDPLWSTMFKPRHWRLGWVAHHVVVRRTQGETFSFRGFARHCMALNVTWSTLLIQVGEYGHYYSTCCAHHRYNVFWTTQDWGQSFRSTRNLMIVQINVGCRSSRITKLC